MSRLLQLLAILLVAGVTGSAFGHEVRPGYLELRQTGMETWRVFWKVPALGEMRLSIHPRFPGSCTLLDEPVIRQTVGAYVEHMTIECKGGLIGRAIAIDGLAATMTDVLVRSVRSDESVQIARLTPTAPTFVLETSPGSLQVMKTYTALGIEHILLGVDHLLFMAALLIIVRGGKRILLTVTAFTVAHSITLVAATLGWLALPGAPVEAAIALSIAFLAREIAMSWHGHAGLTERMPWLVAFVFGLLHGLGFAGALAEIGLPPNAIPVALLCFNVGVEVGQLLFVGMLLGLALSARAWLAHWRPMLGRVPPYAIGAVASFWMIERVVAFWA